MKIGARKTCMLCREELPPRSSKLYCSSCTQTMKYSKKLEGKKRCVGCGGYGGRSIRAGCFPDRWLRCKECKGVGFV